MSVPEAELAPFLDAILAEPDADGPKLVLADYLEERGDRRGQLLREGVAWLRQAAALGPPAADWDHQAPGLSGRRGRLVVVACCRFLPLPGGGRAWDRITDPHARAAVAAAELAAHGLLDRRRRAPLKEAARLSGRGWAATAAVAAMGNGGAAGDVAGLLYGLAWAARKEATAAAQADGAPTYAAAREAGEAAYTLTVSLGRLWYNAVAALVSALTP
jgi:uncharacterized protein (TIGR02996 family)